MTEVTPRFKDPKPPPRQRQWNSNLPKTSKPIKSKPKKHKPSRTGVTPDMRNTVYQRANGQCQAHDLHHPNCPRTLQGTDWAAHHIQPREEDGPDTLDNLIAVWCPGGMGLNGCHGRIHTYRTDAKALGLLRDNPNKWTTTKGQQ